MNRSVSVLFASFDKNSDLWPICSWFWNKYWPDCPWPVYLGANGEDKKAEVPEGWNYINSGNDESWASSMKDYLEALDSKTILLMLDDFLLTAPPDVAGIQKGVALIEDGAAYVRLNPEPPPPGSSRSQKELFGKTRWYDRYRASLKPALWDREALLYSLELHPDPWSFEIEVGAEGNNRGADFYAARVPVLPSLHCIEAGKYAPEIDRFFEAEGYHFLPEREILDEGSYNALFGSAAGLKEAIVSRSPALLYYFYRKVKKTLCAE